MKKLYLSIYINLLRILSFIFFIKELLFDNYHLSFLYGIVLFIVIIFNFRKYKYSFYVENFLYLLIFTYEFNSLYKSPIWDTLMHAIIGYLFCFFILFLYQKKKIKLSPFFLSLFAFSFSLMIGVMFELHEYTMDKLFLRDMQKDMIINEIHTVKFKDNLSKFNRFYEIDKTIIYYHDLDGNQEVFTLNGYLDIGINDTMKDLYVAFIGSLLGSFSIYFKRKYMK